MSTQEFVCSAPGKVLLAGGFLILERPHAGTVLALDARFYSAVRVHLATGPVPEGLQIEVLSPQFHERRRYCYHAQPPRLEALPLTAGGAVPSANKYVEVPLLYTLTNLVDKDIVARAVAPRGAGSVARLEVVLVADNSFYSQGAQLEARGWARDAAALQALPAFLPPTADAGGEMAKTGLGSSATLVTSLVAALLQAFGAIELPAAGAAAGAAAPAADLARLHALAQLCHCAAQGKVGSGFDVCCAVFGSQRYCRFSPEVLKQPLGAPAGCAPVDFLRDRCVEGAWWDQRADPFRLPPGVEVMMGDVACGAHTPSMVKKVQAPTRALEPQYRLRTLLLPSSSPTPPPLPRAGVAQGRRHRRGAVGRVLRRQRRAAGSAAWAGGGARGGGQGRRRVGVARRPRAVRRRRAAQVARDEGARAQGGRGARRGARRLRAGAASPLRLHLPPPACARPAPNWLPSPPAGARRAAGGVVALRRADRAARADGAARRDDGDRRDSSPRALCAACLVAAAPTCHRVVIV